MKYILLADDETEVCRVLEGALTRQGYEVQAVEDGYRALARCHARLPDLVITDIFMPKRDGLEVITELRHYFPSVKIIAMSGNVAGAMFLRVGQRLGADRTLLKPFLVPEFLQTVDEVLN